MRISILLLAMTSLAACTNTPHANVSVPLQPDAPQPVLAHLDLQHPEESLAPPLSIFIGPSFLYASSFVVLKDSAISMTISRLNYRRWALEPVHSRIFEITPSEWQSLVNGITLFNQHFVKPQNIEDIGVDGTGILIASDRLAYRDILHVWSPRRENGAEYYYIIDPLFSILRHHLTDEAEINYCENLEQYFDYGLPIKMISENPWRCRIHGILTEETDETLNQVNSFIDSIPTNVPITIDMSNFRGMADVFQKHFLRLQHRNKQINWIANEMAYEELTAIGIHKDHLSQVKQKQW